jgi:uncharacterized protein YecT (DUF1311 family)
MRLLFVFANLLFIIFLLPARSVGQKFDMIPAEKQKQLRQETSVSVAAKRTQLLAQKLDSTDIEFKLDTFGVETYFEKCHETLKKKGIILTDADMSGQTFDRAQAYDSVMNKYYKRLSSLLKEDDKKVLTQAQRAWLAFRDNEGKLRVAVGMAATGGGTMLQLNESSAYLEMVKTRAIELYEYYNQIINHL